ncbi:MAG: hypothetical protein ABI880_15890 [Acidobacteriota bacterium]
MLDLTPADRPLASYVLRIRGRPAVVRYELHDVRTGARRVFVRFDRLVAFLRQRGLEAAVPETDSGFEG